MVPGQEKDPFAHLYKRVVLLGAVIVCSFAVIGVRLGQLQIVHWSEYKRLSDSNRLRIERIKPPRGMIYGYDGDERVVLADNRASRDLILVPAECTEPELVAERLEQLLGIDGAALLEQIARFERQPFTQIEIEQDLNRSVLARIEEFSYALPGVFTVVRPQRRYIYGATGGQILGFLGEIGPQELQFDPDRYFMGDRVGRAGLEQMYETMLHGRYGQMLVTQHAAGSAQVRTDAYGQPFINVDSFGHPLNEERQLRQDALPGRRLYITLDIGLQRRLESLLQGEQGAIAVLNAETGAVLALASAPDYDPNIFVTSGMDRERSLALTEKPNRMLNRAFQGTYAPGSIFKVLLAIAALEEGLVDEDFTVYCPGLFRLRPNTRAWHCWKRAGHGDTNVVDALAFSCDVFFYTVGLQLGVDRINDYAHRLGMDGLTGIDLPRESTGFVDSRARKMERERSLHPDDKSYWNWYDGDTLNLSIGQGGTAVTPLQGAVMMAAVVNGGYTVRPYLREELGPKRSENHFRDEVVELVVRGLQKCVEKGPPAPTGTGNAAKIPGMTVIGKTGSAQVVSLAHHEEYETEDDIPYEQRDHAWFVSAVLDRSPKLAVCIIVEHGHHGSSAAAPLAKDIFEFYYGRNREPGVLARRSDVGE